jgi:hypothetical protein
MPTSRDPSNLRSLCKQHHSQRTAREQSFEGQRGSSHPAWLKPSLIPLTVVCGAPGSGRHAYVQQRAGPKDMVLDLAGIAAKLSGFPLYDAPQSWYDRALRYRNSRLGLLAYGWSRWPCAWLIASEPRPKWRQWWRAQLGARTVVLETDPALCARTINLDRERSPPAKRLHLDLVRWWWSTYQRDEGDLIIRPGMGAATGRGLLRGGGSLRAGEGQTPLAG